MTQPRTKTVKRLADLIDVVTEHFATTKGLPWFRGHENADWQLLPQVFRNHVPGAEQKMAHAFRLEAPVRHTRCPDESDAGGWITLMQHYGLPTRLLDWTESALVAAFFACGPHFPTADYDAAIWILQAEKLNEHYHGRPRMIQISSDTAIALIMPAFDTESSQPGVVAVKPFHTDMRLAMQQSTFTIHGDPTPLEIQAHSSDYLTKLIIPRTARNLIAAELRCIGVRRSSLFHDLNSLALDIAESV